MMRTEQQVRGKPERAEAVVRPQAREEQAEAPPRVALPCLLPALATALLLWLSYFPVDWGWLGWVALVPLLCLVRSEARPRRIYWSAWAGGLAFFWPALQWMRVADYRMYATWAMLATYCSLYFPLAIFLLRRLDRVGLPLVVNLPVVWTALELARAHVMSGFAWYYLGHTQHDFLAMIQVSDLAGAYGVTFVVAAVNALLFELLYRWPAFRTFLSLPAAAPSCRRCLVIQAAGVALLVAGTVGYGVWRMNQTEFDEGPRVALLQSSIDQRLRNFAAVDPKIATRMGVTYRALCDRARRQTPRPALIVWPETSFPVTWREVSPRLPGSQRLANGYTVAEWREDAHLVRRMVDESATFCGTNVLLGVNSETADDQGNIKRYNSALLVTKLPGEKDRFRVAGRYDKIHRVPFGEYVPLRDWLPFMNAFAPYDYDYGILPGERQTRLPLLEEGEKEPYHFGVLICYEDTDPTLARRFNQSDGNAPPADFVVNISNDGWFDGTSEHDEHLAVCRFRAIEARRAVVRSVNMGISAVIDGNGRVLKPEVEGKPGEIPVWRVPDGGRAEELPPGEWYRFKKTPGVLVANVPLDHRTSLYARWGDWLPGGCWVVLIGGFCGPWFRRGGSGPALRSEDSASRRNNRG